MRGARFVGLLGVALLLLCSGPAGAQGKRAKTKAAPVLPSNLPPERPPPPGAEEGSAAPPASRPAGKSSQLIPGLSNELALAAVGGAVLLLVIILVAAARRRRPAPPRAMTPARAAPRAAERPDRTDPGARGARKPKATLAQPQKETAPPPELRPEQSILLARSGGAPSLHDLAVSLGPDAVALKCLRTATAENLDPLSWSATVKDGRTSRLSRLGLCWGRQVALDRVSAWLLAHPLVKGSGLQLQLPGTLEPSDLENLTLTQADGLGVTLGPEQLSLLDQARAALERAFADQPFALLSASSALGALLPAELSAEVERGHPAHALPLLLCGMPALDWAAKAGLSRPGLGREFREALREHAKLVGTAVAAEGPAVHALEVLGGGRLDGIGMMLAAVAGAAFSASTVILRISKRIGEIKAAPLLGAFSRLGGMVTAILDDESAAERAMLLENFKLVVGEPLLERESKRAAALIKEAERLASRDPIWKGASIPERSLDLALVSLYEVQVRIALERARDANQRLLDMIDRLAHPGSSGEEQSIGHRRLGYVLAGLGAPLLKNTGTELLSAGREALAMTTAIAAVPAK